MHALSSALHAVSPGAKTKTTYRLLASAPSKVPQCATKHARPSPFSRTSGDPRPLRYHSHKQPSRRASLLADAGRQRDRHTSHADECRTGTHECARPSALSTLLLVHALRLPLLHVRIIPRILRIHLRPLAPRPCSAHQLTSHAPSTQDCPRSTRLCPHGVFAFKGPTHPCSALARLSDVPSTSQCSPSRRLTKMITRAFRTKAVRPLRTPSSCPSSRLTSHLAESAEPVSRVEAAAITESTAETQGASTDRPRRQSTSNAIIRLTDTEAHHLAELAGKFGRVELVSRQARSSSSRQSQSLRQSQGEHAAAEVRCRPRPLDFLGQLGDIC
ncbi:uncharacterized protein B0H18DRAFT_1042243 [Fomitopsis serialis]|uniref:uncharacterized protein n=1 Tax=Fomitopsis serialis TaxID=139415 RepID=UPI00200881EB|nr:uncharacterized protein B0H18DRAFT_1042243 [Neoantrodia serialis]KAH9915226.1 hypothetical protein B0H18DRAFT_1042243 [Neoantrodia serialis]